MTTEGVVALRDKTGNTTYEEVMRTVLSQRCNITGSYACSSGGRRAIGAPSCPMRWQCLPKRVKVLASGCGKGRERNDTNV